MAVDQAQWSADLETRLRVFALLEAEHVACEHLRRYFYDTRWAGGMRIGEARADDGLWAIVLFSAEAWIGKLYCGPLEDVASVPEDIRAKHSAFFHEPAFEVEVSSGFFWKLHDQGKAHFVGGADAFTALKALLPDVEAFCRAFSSINDHDLVPGDVYKLMNTSG